MNAGRASATQPLLIRADEGGVATLTLNRPDSFNALNRELLAQLRGALRDISAESRVRVAVIAGAGRAFCAGHDLRELLDSTGEDFIAGLFRDCSALMLEIRRLRQPVIASVHGVATAAGCQLVAACDLAVASEDARFATSGVNLGLFCATPAVAVSRSLTVKRAFELLFTGDFIDAATALDWGLVNRVVAAPRLAAQTASLAAQLATKPRKVIAEGKRVFYEQLGRPVDEAYSVACEAMTRNMLGPAAREGISAFLNKRPPAWPD